MEYYCKNMNRPKTKLISVGMTASHNTIADIKDPNMLAVCGFDTQVPQIISNFLIE